MCPVSLGKINYLAIWLFILFILINVQFVLMQTTLQLVVDPDVCLVLNMCTSVLFSELQAQ